MIWQRPGVARVILAFAAVTAGAACAPAQQAEYRASAAQSQPNAMPKSGALVALDNGQTLWIAPVNGKIQVIAADDYVIPRKDGFWRIRLEFRELPESGQSNADRENQEGGGAPMRLWAVPLRKGKNAVAWAAKESAANTTQDASSQETEQADSNMQGDDEPIRQELLFLSSDHISFHTQSGEYSETYSILKIVDDPAKKGLKTEALRVYPENPPIPEDVRAKDLKACIDPTEELATEDFLTGATEVSYGIVHGRGKWDYTWLLGYSGGAARGYHTGCAVSMSPPKSVVGYNELFPAWDAVKDVYPDAEDVFTSPSHDMILVLYQTRLMIAPLQQGKVGRPLARLELSGKPVMVQWALGNYVDVWTKELTPYFGTYKPKPKGAQ
jgi:hypothetical protein